VRDLLTSTFKLGPLSRVAYLTVNLTLLGVQDRLEKARVDGFWKRVYLAAAKELELQIQLKELAQTTQALYEQSIVFSDKQLETVEEALRSIGDGALRVVEILKPEIKLGSG